MSILIMSALLFYLKNNPIVFSVLARLRRFVLSKTPYAKDIYFYWHIEKWLKVVHMSTESLIPISQALLFGSDAIQDKGLKAQFEKVHVSVRKGNGCAQSLQMLDKNIYKKIKDWTSIIDSGERTGTFAEVFGICHANIKESLFNAFDRFQRMVEPLLIIFVGIIVLIICISIILPMYQLTQSLQ
jgi:type IV pilus assembly protein PilC